MCNNKNNDDAKGNEQGQILPKPEMPHPPEGFQRPGIPGSGNILDPEVRGKLRAALQDAVMKAVESLVQQHPQPPAAAPAAPAAPAPAPAAPAQKHRAGPHPHGDVDLSFINANVPAEPVKPNRGGAGRKFYFLQKDG